MTERDALLAAIRANPDDDTVRLAFADWLDEHPSSIESVCPRCNGTQEAEAYQWVKSPPMSNPPRKDKIGKQACHLCENEWQEPTGVVITPSGNREHAEFIRLGIELHSNPYKGMAITLPNSVVGITDPRRDRAIELQKRMKWLQPKLSIDSQFVEHYAFLSRGFVHTVRCSLDTWLAHGPTIVRSPVACVELVEITDRTPTPIHLSGGYGPLSWHSYPDRNPRSYIPMLLFEILSNGDSWHNRGPGDVLGYDTEPEARDALSKACIEWAGRQQ